MFITLEGPDGAGKSSHIPNIVEFLQNQGYTVFATYEPGGHPISEQIRQILHSLDNTEIHPRAETLLYQAARVQSVEKIIKPHLEKGKIVVSDRYILIANRICEN